MSRIEIHQCPRCHRRMTRNEQDHWECEFCLAESFERWKQIIALADEAPELSEDEIELKRLKEKQSALLFEARSLEDAIHELHKKITRKAVHNLLKGNQS